MPGQADGSVAVTLGYGRTAAGQVGGSSADGVAPVGVDVYRLRHERRPCTSTRGCRSSRRARTIRLATTQDHHAIDAVGMEAAPNGSAVGPRGELSHPREARAGRARSRATDLRSSPSIAVARSAAGIAVAGAGVRGASLGHGDRPVEVHRLRGVRGGLPGREQHAGGGQGAGAQRPRDALAAGRPLLPRRAGRSRRSSISR